MSGPKLLVVAEHDQGEIPVGTLEAITAARGLSSDVEVVVLGPEGVSVAAELAGLGAVLIHTIEHEIIPDFGAEAYAVAIGQLIDSTGPAAVVACGTDRGNEVLAMIAARRDLPFSANVVAVDAGAGPWQLTRQQWGGSLLEDSTLDGVLKVFSFAHHMWEPATVDGAASPVKSFDVDLDAALSATVIKGRTVTEAGVTLATARFVVSGGRAMKNAENFAMLEELAELLGGRVGCSRAVTNNGWRNHADQVGQTGTRIAPECYLACGISGATQHWVGAMGSKNVIAVNIDKEANLVTKSGHAVIADLFEIVPAIIAEVKKRKGLNQ